MAGFKLASIERKLLAYFANFYPDTLGKLFWVKFFFSDIHSLNDLFSHALEF